MFWVNVPVGIYGTIWAYLRLRDNGERHPARIDWWGNVTFAVGLSALLIAVTYGPLIKLLLRNLARIAERDS